MTTIMKQEKAHVELVSINDLSSLKDTTFNLPKHATRDIDWNHVFNLSETDASKWPPIKVVETEDEGLVVIDGYHRWEALRRAIKVSVLGVEEATPAAQKKALEAPLDEATQEKIDLALQEATISAEIGVYATEKDVAKAALTANLTHGLPPKGKALVSIAVELFDLTRGDTPEPSQAEIARMVGISRATLNEYLKKREKQEAKEEKQPVAEGTPEGEPAETDDSKEVEKLMKAVDRVIGSLEKLYELSPNAYSEAMYKLLPVVLVGVAESNTDVDDKTYADKLRRTIEYAEDIKPQDINHVVRFNKNLSQAIRKLAVGSMKTSEKQEETTA